jgi:hypothetical protein
MHARGHESEVQPERGATDGAERGSLKPGCRDRLLEPSQLLQAFLYLGHSVNGSMNTRRSEVVPKWIHGSD